MFHMWSQTSPLAPLLSTFGSILALQGSVLASFGFLFLFPKAPFWDHLVSEILEHQFLEHPRGVNTSQVVRKKMKGVGGMAEPQEYLWWWIILTWGGTMFAHVVPELVLGAIFANFWHTFGPPRLHFGLIWVPFFAPKASILGPYGFRNLGASISGTPQWLFQKSWTLSVNI